jgi:hypothetical protein
LRVGTRQFLCSPVVELTKNDVVQNGGVGRDATQVGGPPAVPLILLLGLKSCFASFVIADANGFFNAAHEYFAVADTTRTCR